MKLKIVINPGTYDFPELASDLPHVGDVREFDGDTADKLLKMRLAVPVEKKQAAVEGVAKTAEVKAIPPAPLSQFRNQPKSGK